MNTHVRPLFLSAPLLLAAALPGRAGAPVEPVIEVTGSATLNIVPDRITVEIGMEEYYDHRAAGDSVLVPLADIEKEVRDVLRAQGVSDSAIIVQDLGNYRDRNVSATFLMAKRISATVTDLGKIDSIAARLCRKGITGLDITNAENSDIGRYNRDGLKSALDAAREKAEFIAANEGLTLLSPIEIVETTNEPARYGAFSNVAYDSGSGMDGLRRIVRRYSVKVRYLFENDK